jgi:membrane protease YdiL (CAAX protease family)
MHALPLEGGAASAKKRGRQELFTFLVLAFGLSSIFYYLIISAGGMQSEGAGLVVGLMWCPGIAALITRLAFQRNLRGLGWGLGKLRYLLASYGTPLAYALLAYGAVWLASRGAFFNSEVLGKIAERLNERFGWGVDTSGAAAGAFFLLVATQGVLVNCLFALGEELGWRGLLVPRLAETQSFTRTSAISGAIWAVWHWPLILLAGYEGGSRAFSLAAFTLMVVAASFIFAWLRLASGSVWTAVLLHGSHNAFLQGFFDPLTRSEGAAKYLAGEFGIVTAVAVVLVAWWYWRRRGKLPSEAAPAPN